MRCRGVAASAFFVVTALVVAHPAVASRAGVGAHPGELRVPAGYEVVARQPVADGVEHVLLRRAAPDQVVNVAFIAPGAPVALRPVLSNEAVAGPGPRRERTSAMCARVRCLIAVNGDYAVPQIDEPFGDVIIDGRTVRSSTTPHDQLLVGPPGAGPSRGLRLATGALPAGGALVASDLSRVQVHAVNVPRSAEQLVVYLPTYGPSTGTNQFGAELVVEVGEGADAATGGAVSVRLVDFRDGVGDTPIPPHGAVLSGHGAAGDQLRELWRRVQEKVISPDAALRVERPADVLHSVGGSPVIVRDGKATVPPPTDDFVTGRHPRTIVGWNASGASMLVTVDGRQPGYSEGMSLAEAAALLLGLGADQALNLDGGGSTTFVVGGGVVNRPSDRAVRRPGENGERIVRVPSPRDVVLGQVERPVTIALALVPVDVATFAGAAGGDAAGADAGAVGGGGSGGRAFGAAAASSGTLLPRWEYPEIDADLLPMIAVGGPTADGAMPAIVPGTEPVRPGSSLPAVPLALAVLLLAAAVAAAGATLRTPAVRAEAIAAARSLRRLRVGDIGRPIRYAKVSNGKG